MDKAIPAHGLDTATHAIVIILVVAVVTGFIGLVVGLEPLPQNSITAAGEDAGVGAGISVDAVAVIADLAHQIHHPVAADLHRTVPGATIAVV